MAREGYATTCKLPKRIANHWPFNEADSATIYGGIEIGYNDYPYYQNS